jgi:mRNA interferase RelE/StbE
MFELILSKLPADFFANADRILAKKLARCFAVLEEDPKSGNNNIKSLSGVFAGHYRYRIGDWRVVYRIDFEQSKVYVIAIAHRSEVYE